MFKPTNCFDPMYDHKECPHCEKFSAQLIGYDDEKDELDVLHRCCYCGKISPFWQEAEKEVITS